MTSAESQDNYKHRQIHTENVIFHHDKNFCKIFGTFLGVNCSHFGRLLVLQIWKLKVPFTLNFSLPFKVKIMK